MTYRFLAPLLLAALFFTCANESSYAPENSQVSVEYAREAEEMGDKGATYSDKGASGQPNPTITATSPKIVYTAAARGRVANLDTALVRLTRQVTTAGGHISNQHRTNSNWEHTATLTIRLPASQLAGTLGFIPSLTEEVDYQNLDSRDVTAEWLDLESRLQTKRDVRDRYIDILRNKAKKVEDILNAEDKIRVITEEIEAKEGRLRYLRDQVSLSTLTLELYETREYRDVGPTTTRSFGSELVASLSTGWELTRDLLLGLVAIWPLLLLGGIVFWLVRRWRRRK